jgi:hypothetical protein
VKETSAFNDGGGEDIQMMMMMMMCVCVCVCVCCVFARAEKSSCGEMAIVLLSFEFENLGRKKCSDLNM